MTTRNLEIPLVVGPAVYATYRRITYRIDSALCEFVDNSTQSYFANKRRLQDLDGSNFQLKINIVHDRDTGTLTIQDNANGMSESELLRAIKLNEPPPDTTGRSEFGMGLKMAANEFIAYGRLAEWDGTDSPVHLSERSRTILTYALCGFANFSSIGIQLGGIGGIAPKRRGDLAKLGFRAMLGGTLAAFMTACVASILL